MVSYQVNHALVVAGLLARERATFGVIGQPMETAHQWGSRLETGEYPVRRWRRSA